LGFLALQKRFVVPAMSEGGELYADSFVSASSLGGIL
jgi:hypothetical protein